MKILTPTEIEACRRIGRDEAAKSTTIGLAELDALCDTAQAYHNLKQGGSESQTCRRLRNSA